MQRKKLPIGIQTFARIRGDDYYYVDKTPLALKLIEEGSHYFLSRPRRFGKSLLVDTLAELFEGNEPLFRGLYCHDKWDWSVQYPVIRFSFAEGRLERREQLDARIMDLLDINQQHLGVNCPKHLDIPGCFGALLRAAHQKYGRRVVVLVDEYDKPILDNLTTPEVATAMREGLRNLYSVIKGHDAHVHFAFLTGVSKFSKVSIFSGLNNLNDITVDAPYSALCGYTEQDLDEVFAPELEGLDRQQIRDWYNGYNWTGESVYNPFDLLLLFDKRAFRNYWFETGTPTFLIDLLRARQTHLPLLQQRVVNEALLSAFDVGRIATEALMWQAGYLTFDRVENLFGEYRYHLRYPNREVYQSLSNGLLMAWSGGERYGASALENKYQLGNLLLANDFPGMRQLFTRFFATIPHDWYRNNPITDYEGYWASVFYAYFAALGLDIRLEDVTNQGRIDMTVLFNGQVYLFEFKVVELLPDGKAIEQLKARHYAEKYQDLGQPIYLIGIEFSKDERNVVGFDVEHLRT